MSKRVGLAAKLCSAIGDAIVSGEFPPGSQLDDRELAERFGTSRTPVREAILQLAGEGLVEIFPRSGTFVALPSSTELLAVLECLALFEAAAARLAARRMSLPDKEAFAATVRGFSDLPSAGKADRMSYEELNLQFHEAIYRGCDNPVLADQIRSMRRRITAWGRSFFESSERIGHSAGEHRAIAAAIIVGDEQTASDRMAEHIGAGAKYLTELISSIQPRGLRRARRSSTND